MQKKKIDALYRLLGCNNSDIARMLGCSPSDISRVHNGSRRYNATSRPILRFAEGLYLYAQQTGASAALGEICGADSLNREDMISAAAKWLFDESPVPQVDPDTSHQPYNAKKQNKRFFGEKLSAVMELLSLSNMRLARYINVDASTVSRFRSGLRRPKSPIDDLLVSALFRRAELLNKQDALFALCGSGNRPRDVSSFAEWLYDDSVSGVGEIGELLESIERFSPAGSPPAFPPDLGISTAGETSNTYWGIDGLRRAVLRFLAETAAEGGELLLYSDQDMAWMVQDEEFRARWAMLMGACIARGVKMRIIHNTDRGTGEMLEAIRSWMPLYVSGGLRPFVCNLGRDARFAKTLFLRKDRACISGSVLRGSEKHGYYDYVTDEKKLAAHLAEYEGLLAHSSPLLRVYFEESGFPRREGGETKLLSPAPSVATLDEATLDEALANVDNATADKIRAFADAKRRSMEKSRTGGKVTEFICLPSPEELARGRVMLNLPSSLCPGIPYTPALFAAHIASALRLWEEDHGYEIVLLPDLPFPHLQITACPSEVAVIRNAKPYTEFVFSEKRLVRSFFDYFSLLEKQHRTDPGKIRIFLADLL